MLVSTGLKSTEKNFTIPFNPVFFILLIVKSFIILPKHSAQSFISEVFILNWYTFVELTNINCCFHYSLDFTNLFPDCVKLIGYFASAVNMVSFNPCVDPSPRIKISFNLFSTCTDEVISTTKIMTFFPMVPSGNENSERESIPMW